MTHYVSVVEVKSTGGKHWTERSNGRIKHEGRKLDVRKGGVTVGGVPGRGKEGRKKGGNIIVQKRMICSGIYFRVIIYSVQYFHRCLPCKRKIMKVYILLWLSNNKVYIIWQTLYKMSINSWWMTLQGDGSVKIWCLGMCQDHRHTQPPPTITPIIIYEWRGVRGGCITRRSCQSRVTLPKYIQGSRSRGFVPRGIKRPTETSAKKINRRKLVVLYYKESQDNRRRHGKDSVRGLNW